MVNLSIKKARSSFQETVVVIWRSLPVKRQVPIITVLKKTFPLTWADRGELK